MIEKRFSWKTEKLQHLDNEVIMVVDNKNKEWKGHILNIVDLLNEQQATIQQLKERNAHNFAKKMQLMKEIKELKEEEKLYAKEIVRLNKNIEELNKTIEEALKFKSLGGDY